MGFLKAALLIAYSLCSPLDFAFAQIVTAEQLAELRTGWGDDGLHRDHCKATEEYIKTLEFLRKEEVIPENEARQIARKVSEGCGGASERFIKAYLMMQKSGVSLQKSVDVGLALTKEDPLTVRNFHEIFEKMYLGEYLDVNFKSSFEIAFELSRNFKGNLEMARKDFNEFSKFCMDHKKVGLSVTQCAKLAVSFARLSQYYPRGVFSEFKTIYELLREDKRFGVGLKEGLELSEQILQNGPAAKLNFIQAYNYATTKSGMNLTGREALTFALGMARLSHAGETPPIFAGEQMLRPASQVKTAENSSKQN